MFIDNEVVHTSFTSTDEEQGNSSSDKDTFEIRIKIISPYVDHKTTLSYCTTGINLEVALEIDHEDLYANITSAP